MQQTIKEYILHEIIGEGSFGTVFHATHASNSSHYAVKLIPITKYLTNNKLHQYTDNELKILSRIGPSTHIINFFELIKTDNYYYFVYEYCEGGTLMDLIRREGRLEEKKAMKIFRELLEAFKVLNKYNITHRDLKPENVFFSDGKVKLGDFGFCKELGQRENLTKTMIGSPIYMAPEVLKGESYNSKVDIWSLGVILYEMLYGVCPFQSRSIAMLISNIQRHNMCFPSEANVSLSTQKLIKRMLTKDYYRRISWIELFGYLSQEERYISSKAPQVSHSLPPESLSSFLSPNTETSFSFSAKKPEEEKQVGESVTSFDDEKKRSPLAKNQKNKKFYSHQYMKIFERPIFRRNGQNRITISLEKQTNGTKNTSYRENRLTPQKQIIPSISAAHITTAAMFHDRKNFEEKFNSILSTHKKCLQILQTTFSLLERQRASLLADSYLVLSVVYQKMNKIKYDIEKQQNLLELSSMVNFQIIQLDRLLSEVRSNSHTRQTPHHDESKVRNKKLKQLLENFE